MDASRLWAEGAEKGRGNCTVAAGETQAVEMVARVVLPDAAGSGVATGTSDAGTAIRLATMALRCALKSACPRQWRLHKSGKLAYCHPGPESQPLRPLASVLQS